MYERKSRDIGLSELDEITRKLGISMEAFFAGPDDSENTSAVSQISKSPVVMAVEMLSSLSVAQRQFALEALMLAVSGDRDHWVDVLERMVSKSGP